MVSNISKKIPLLNKISFMQKYALYLQQSEFKIDALMWILAAIIFSAIPAVAGYLFLPSFLILEIILFVALADLIIGMPYLNAVKRIQLIEDAFPNCLRQMADTLKSGGTYEYALREVASSNYGPIKKEFEKILRKLEEGENFENSFKTLSEDVDSKIIQRTVTIIIDSVKAGAGLSEILEQIAEDIREMNRLSRERKSRTMMQVLFMVAAGGIIAPMIFGFVSTVVKVLIKSATGAVEKEAIIIAEQALSTITFSIEMYILIEVLATSLMISLMRDGNMNKSILYIPFLLLIAFTAYYLGMIGSQFIVGNVG
ncbi:MAG: type II secretion system F family protein [Candidatus Diapherotrites archaeon]|nr:type II secretion system F family protein [Candidatus Diapherotrites archaeon]